MSLSLYVVDTSALFAAWVERYPPELFGSVWRFVNRLGDRLIVCEEVWAEIDRHAANDRVDDRSDMGGQVASMRFWLQESPVNTDLSLNSLAEDASREVQSAMRTIANGWPRWNAVHRQGSADPWVIAYAKTLGGAVVSEEVPRSSNRGPKIPDVCYGMGVPHLNLLELFRV